MTMPLAAANWEDGLVRPLRDNLTRGGKAWQPYAASACVEVVGGDSSRFLDWLARLELELGSMVAEQPVLDDNVPAPAKVEIYRLYSDAMRAGRAARGLSIRWDDELARKAVETGRGYELEAKVLALYRLKAALPAGLLARVGAILGGGSPAQIEGLGAYFEATALASQIMVDVLELRGFEAGLPGGWDNTQQGRLTLPIVKALGMLAHARREWLCQTLQGPPIVELGLRRAVYELEDIGALPACTQLARDLVEGAWQRLDPTLEDSRAKVTICTFGRYVLDWQQSS
jgi:hypothetical protein